jgi:hypothetical protein
LISGAISHGEKSFLKWIVNEFEITKIPSCLIATGINVSEDKEDEIYNILNWLAKKNYIVDFEYKGYRIA